MNNNDINAINEIKIVALDMVSNAKSGNPGIALSMAPILYTLYARHLNVNPENPDWINRDRVVLSTASASSVYYATLYLCGYPITKENLMNYKSITSTCTSHPDSTITKGVDFTTGLSGSGIAGAVGIALAERYLENIIKSEDEKEELIDFYTYCLCSENDLMEGVSYEALSFASKEKLEKLILIVDHNKVTNDVGIEESFTEDLNVRFESLNFYVENVKDGNNIKAIERALTNARKIKKPAVVIVSTILGKDSRNEGNSIVFNSPLDDDDVLSIKRKLNITLPPFETRKDTILYIEKRIKERVIKKYTNYIEYFNKIKSSGNERFITIMKILIDKNCMIPFESLNYRINDTYNEDIRVTNHKVMNILASKSEFFLGGGADTSSTTKVYLDKTNMMSNDRPLGRNINFGSRELAMGFILNGMSSLGLKVYGNTYLGLGDFLKPAMRFSAFMDLPVSYVFTNDSIINSEDGPLFTPIEQLSMLRTIPKLFTFRPCDISEIFGCWEFIAKNKKATAVILGNQVVSKIPNSNAKLVLRGGYIIKKEVSKLDGIIISTGTEVKTALNLSEELQKNNLDIRIVSMPCQELFLLNDKEYRNQILPQNIKIIVLEPSNDSNWLRFTSEKYILGIKDFSYYGKSNEVLKKFEYDYENLKIKVMKLFLE